MIFSIAIVTPLLRYYIFLVALVVVLGVVKCPRHRLDCVVFLLYCNTVILVSITIGTALVSCVSSSSISSSHRDYVVVRFLLVLVLSVVVTHRPPLPHSQLLPNRL